MAQIFACLKPIIIIIRHKIPEEVLYTHVRVHNNNFGPFEHTCTCSNVINYYFCGFPRRTLKKTFLSCITRLT